MAYENDVYTRNEDSELAVRVVTATEGTNNSSYDDVFTRDTNGKLAVRVVGAGGGDSHNLGYFATPQALSEAYPTGEEGDYAIVGSTDTVWIWDSGTSAWVDTDTKGQVESVNGQTGAVTLGINDVAPTQTGKSGYVLGTDGFVAGWVKPEIVQVSAMPVASEDEVDNIYQYVGTTDANYTNGYFYKCVSDGQDPATYSWTQTDVQPQAGGLPDQTGNAGKFLITNGTTAEWGAKLPASVLSTDSYGKGYQLSRYGTTGLKVTCTWDNYGSTRGYYVFDANTFWGYYDAYSRPKLGDYNYPWSIVYASSLSNGQNNTITIPATAGVMAVQVTTVPTAGSTYVGQIYQYIGATDSTYTHGYIYECKAQGTDPETYAWQQTNVQPAGGSGLPSQTGNAGKFLTTDGTDASWSDKPLVNNSTNRTGCLTIATSNSVIKSDYNTAIGIDIQNVGKAGALSGNASVVIGNHAGSYDGSCICVGASAVSRSPGGICIGYDAFVDANATGAIQIGRGSNTTAQTLQIGFYTGSSTRKTFRLLNSNGSVPTDRWVGADSTTPVADGTYVPTLTISSGTATRTWAAPSGGSTALSLTLAAANWSNNTIMVTATGVTASNNVIVSPAPASQSAYTTAGVMCTGQSTDSLTFSCNTTPSSDIVVTVLIV